MVGVRAAGSSAGGVDVRGGLGVGGVVCGGGTHSCVEDRRSSPALHTSLNLTIDSLIQPKEPVRAAGFPIGGESFCVTAGVVSRIESLEYSHSGRLLLGLQVRACGCAPAAAAAAARLVPVRAGIMTLRRVDCQWQARTIVLTGPPACLPTHRWTRR